MITIIIGRAAQFILALAMLRVATTLLSPVEMGKVSLTLTTIAFFAMFLVNPVGMFINRRLHAWQAAGVARQYLIRYVAYLVMVVLVAAAGLLVFNVSGWVKFGIPIWWLVFLVCGSLLLNTINQTSIPSLNMLGESRKFVFLTVATIAASFATATVLVNAFQFKAEYWLLGLLAGQAVLALIGTNILFSKLKSSEDHPAIVKIQKRHLRVLISYSWPVGVAAGLAWAQAQGYRYLMEDQLGLASLGLFVAGYSVSAGMIVAFESVLTTYFQPRLYRDISDALPEQQAEAWHRYAVVVIPSIILTVSMIVTLAPELTQLLLGEHFQQAAAFVIWGALVEAARVLMGVYSLIAHVHMRTRWLILPNLTGAIVSITLCAILLPVLGATGAGVGLAVSGASVVILMHMLLASRVGGGIPIRVVLRASAYAAGLWSGAHVIRNMVESPGLGASISMFLIVGIGYLGLQYLILRPHLSEAR